MKIRDVTKHATVSMVLFSTVVFASLPAKADIVTFHFTGRLTVADPSGVVIDDDTDGYTPITADLTIDTAFTGGGLNTGALIGSSTLDVLAGAPFLGDTPRFYGMTLAYGGSGVIGNFFVDWNGNTAIPVQVDWDVTGLATAIGNGLQVGDRISGNELWRDTDGNGTADTLHIANLGSATPYADTLSYLSFPDFNTQGPAPMAATANSEGVALGTAFGGIRGYIDIGSGNSMTVTAINAVPVPAAIWLFSSGLLGLIGVARKKVA